VTTSPGDDPKSVIPVAILCEAIAKIIAMTKAFSVVGSSSLPSKESHERFIYKLLLIGNQLSRESKCNYDLGINSNEICLIKKVH